MKLGQALLAIPLFLVSIGVAACGGSDEAAVGAASTVSEASSAAPAVPSPTSAIEEAPSPSASPDGTPSSAASTTEFNPICGRVASQEKYMVGEWQGFFSEDTKGEGDRIVFTEDCQVMADDDIDFNAPDGEWSQKGGNVRFVLVMNLDDKAPNLYKGSLDADGNTLTGISRNGVFQFTRVVPGGQGETAAQDAPEGDQAAVAADFAQQWESLNPADARAKVCEVYRNNASVQENIAISSLAVLEEQGSLSVGSRRQYETAAIDYFKRTC